MVVVIPAVLIMVVRRTSLETGCMLTLARMVITNTEETDFADYKS